MGIEALAAELLFDICDLLSPLHTLDQPVLADEYFDTHGSNDILALASTCTTLRRTCWPRVFRNLRLHHPKAKLAALSTQPRLMEGVRTLSLRFVDKWGGSPSFFDGLEQLLAIGTLQTIAISVEMLMADTPQLTRVLSWLFDRPSPELTNIFIRLRYLPAGMDPPTVFQFSNPLWSRIQTFQYKIEYHSLAPQIFEIWSSLSSLRSLHLGLPGQGPSTWSHLITQCFPLVPLLKELVIADSRIKAERMLNFLQAILPGCNRLTSLSIDFTIDFVPTGHVTDSAIILEQLRTTQFDWAQLVSAGCPRMKRVSFGRMAVVSQPVQGAGFLQQIGSKSMNMNTKLGVWTMRKDETGGTMIELLPAKVVSSGQVVQ